MLCNEQILSYCRQVAGQIRWKRARLAVMQELEQHILDQQAAYQAQGYGEEEATQMALDQMGNAREIGQALNQIHHPQTPWLLLGLTAGLLVLGAALQFALFPGEFSAVHYLAALILFAIGYFGDVSWLGRHALKINAGMLLVSSAALLCAEPVKGAAVFQIDPFQMRLCYLALIFPICYGLLVYSMKDRGRRGIVFCVLAYVPYAVILLRVPTLSGFLIYSFTAWVLLMTAVQKNWFTVQQSGRVVPMLIPTFLPCFALAAMMYSVDIQNLYVFFAPEQDAEDAGYIYCLLRNAISQSAFWGEGAIDLSTIPELSTDYVLVYGIQKFGLGSFALIILLVLALCVFCVYQGMRQQSMLGTLLVLSIALTIALQSLLYGYGNVGYGFLSNLLSFPFLARGGTALALNSLQMGCMLSVLRTGTWICDTAYHLAR